MMTSKLFIPPQRMQMSRLCLSSSYGRTLQWHLNFEVIQDGMYACLADTRLEHAGIC